MESCPGICPTSRCPDLQVLLMFLWEITRISSLLVNSFSSSKTKGFIREPSVPEELGLWQPLVTTLEGLGFQCLPITA